MNLLSQDIYERDIAFGMIVTKDKNITTTLSDPELYFRAEKVVFNVSEGYLSFSGDIMGRAIQTRVSVESIHGLSELIEEVFTPKGRTKGPFYGYWGFERLKEFSISHHGHNTSRRLEKFLQRKGIH